MYSITYTRSLRVNSPQGLRERFAYFLRRLAQCIDGNLSLGIAMGTTPAISLEDKLACVRHGVDAIEWALETSVRLECAEVILEKVRHGPST